MPEIKTITVAPADLRRDDVLVRPGSRPPLNVTQIDPKIKWIYVHVVSGDTKSTVKLPRDTTVQVERQVETEEEKAARKREWELELLRNSVNKLHTDPAAYLTEQVTKAGTRPDVLDYFKVAAFLHLQAQAKLWQQIHGTAIARMARRDDADPDEALIDVLADLWLRHTRSYPSSPTSRSSAVVANLMEDIDNYETARLFEDLKYGGMSLVTARAAEFNRSDY